MKRLILASLTALGLTPAFAGGTAGDFDYYVLSLSWSPNWCDREGNAKGSPQCAVDADFGWVLHGLWPQYETGWPDYCPTSQRSPSRSDTAAMADIMGTSGLAWHQWKKHGVCSGLSSDKYYDISRQAFDAVIRPPIFRKLTKDYKLPASVVEQAFIEENPKIAPDMITVTCKQDQIQEVRICLTRDLELRICGSDVIRDCSLDDALFLAID